MKLDDVIYGRRSVRSYDGKVVAEHIIRRLIDAAVQAPSAMDEQPWIFSVIRDLDLLGEISTYAKAHILAGEVVHVPEKMREMLADPHFHIFHHAPALVVISGPEKSAWLKENCALAAENFMLAAYEHGLGTCWIGFAQHWLGLPQGRRAIQLPDGYVPVAPIILGYPRSQTAHKPRHAPKIKWIDSGSLTL